jgi:16S rRNA (cytosine967-C5)-methyltransferase
VEAIPQFSKGWFEVQDLGSQIAAAAAGEVKGKQVLDFCAGGGGKTLALAAAMGNTGQIYAYDSDARRLADCIRRGQRAGVRNLQIRSPIEPTSRSRAWKARSTSSSSTRPAPAPAPGAATPTPNGGCRPTSWPSARSEQDSVLDDGRLDLREGRRPHGLCHLFAAADENEDRVAAFLERHPEFAVKPIALDPASSTSRPKAICA